MKATFGDTTPESRTSILIVEDDPELSDVLKQELEKEGVQVQCTNSAQDGIVRIRNQEFSLIVLDMSLHKGGSGEQVIQAVRDAKIGLGSKMTPIVVTSGSLRAELVRRIATEVMGVFVKPYDVHQVIDRVKSILRLS